MHVNNTNNGLTLQDSSVPHRHVSTKDSFTMNAQRTCGLCQEPQSSIVELLNQARPLVSMPDGARCFNHPYLPPPLWVGGGGGHQRQSALGDSCPWALVQSVSCRCVGCSSDKGILLSRVSNHPGGPKMIWPTLEDKDNTLKYWKFLLFLWWLKTRLVQLSGKASRSKFALHVASDTFLF